MTDQPQAPQQPVSKADEIRHSAHNIFQEDLDRLHRAKSEAELFRDKAQAEVERACTHLEEEVQRNRILSDSHAEAVRQLHAAEAEIAKLKAKLVRLLRTQKPTLPAPAPKPAKTAKFA